MAPTSWSINFLLDHLSAFCFQPIFVHAPSVMQIRKHLWSPYCVHTTANYYRGHRLEKDIISITLKGMCRINHKFRVWFSSTIGNSTEVAFVSIQRAWEWGRKPNPLHAGRPIRAESYKIWPKQEQKGKVYDKQRNQNKAGTYMWNCGMLSLVRLEHKKCVRGCVRLESRVRLNRCGPAVPYEKLSVSLCKPINQEPKGLRRQVKDLIYVFGRCIGIEQQIRSQGGRQDSRQERIKGKMGGVAARMGRRYEISRGTLEPDTQGPWTLDC